jgi:CheY-like chemotaxis protein/cell division septation protein DedD
VGSTNNILVIDNDPDTLDLVKETLEQLGASVYTAESADIGITMAHKMAPSLILVNLATPGANGLEICKKLQAEDENNKIPIYLLTMREGKFDPAYTKLYGIRGFLKKPVDPSSLLSEVQNFIQMGDYSGQDEYIPTFDTSDEASPSFETESDQPASEPEVALSEVEDEMALPDELKDTLIQAGPGGAPAEEGMTEASYEAPLSEGGADMSFPEESPFESGEEASRGEANRAPQGVDIQNEESEEDFFEGGLPHEEESETDFEEFLTEETMKAEDQSESEVKRSLKKNSRLSKKILIPAILLPVLIAIAVISYIFIFQGSPTPQLPVPQRPAPQQPVPPKIPVQTVTPAPEASVEPKTVPPPPVPSQVAPVPAPPKKVEPPIKPRKTTAYYVQFGNFSSEQNAKKLVNQLRSKGLNTFIKKGTAKNGSMSFRVLLDKEFTSIDHARNESHRIKDNKRVDSFPYTVKAK